MRLIPAFATFMRLPPLLSPRKLWFAGEFVEDVDVLDTPGPAILPACAHRPSGSTAQQPPRLLHRRQFPAVSARPEEPADGAAAGFGHPRFIAVEGMQACRWALMVVCRRHPRLIA